MYCGYVNGWLAYATQIAGRTELYWCAIKHNNASGDFHEPEHHAGFAKYNDEDDLEKKFPKS